MIDSYFEFVERLINRFLMVSNFTVNKRKLSENFGIIQGQLFIGENVLDFLEVVQINDLGDAVKIKYKYHFRDLKNVLIFRYDNVPHFPDMDTFPHHKHIKGAVLKSNEPKLYDIMKEIETDQSY